MTKENDNTRLIELPVSKAKVTLKNSISYGERMEIEGATSERMTITQDEEMRINDGVKQARFKAFKAYIVKIEDKDGKPVPFSSMDWINKLDEADGVILNDAINDAQKRIKELKKKLQTT